MMSLEAAGPGGPLWSAEAPLAFVGEVDCNRSSPDSGSPECEERAQTGMGVVVVAAVLFLVVGYIVWRRMLRNVDEKPPRGEQDGSS
jgi:hypothetical protein